MDDPRATPGPDLEVTDRTRLRRKPDRGRFDRATVHGILDEGLVAHVGYATDRGPVVLPMAYGRDGDRLLLHGASANAMLRQARDSQVCVTVTILDGLVLARSAFHHSMNYRTVVVFGQPIEIDDPGEKLRGLAAIVDHVAPGRMREVRAPTPTELRATRVLALAIDEASAKVRSGPPVDDEADLGLPVWAGEVPLQLVAGPPVPDAALPIGVAVPAYLATYGR